VHGLSTSKVIRVTVHSRFQFHCPVRVPTILTAIFLHLGHSIKIPVECQNRLQLQISLRLSRFCLLTCHPDCSVPRPAMSFLLPIPPFITFCTTSSCYVCTFQLAPIALNLSLIALTWCVFSNNSFELSLLSSTYFPIFPFFSGHFSIFL